ncbi:MAG: hypothetical protein ACR2M9_00995 [Cyanophyceae cyanobacterium]
MSDSPTITFSSTDSSSALDKMASSLLAIKDKQKRKADSDSDSVAKKSKPTGSSATADSDSAPKKSKAADASAATDQDSVAATPELPQSHKNSTPKPIEKPATSKKGYPNKGSSKPPTQKLVPSSTLAIDSVDKSKWNFHKFSGGTACPKDEVIFHGFMTREFYITRKEPTPITTNWFLGGNWSENDAIAVKKDGMTIELNPDQSSYVMRQE